MFKKHSVQIKMVKDAEATMNQEPTWTPDVINDTIEKQGRNLVKAIVIVAASLTLLSTTEAVIVQNSKFHK